MRLHKIGICTVLAILFCFQVNAAEVTWQEFFENPVIFSEDHRSYYPNIVFNGDFFLMYSDYATEGEEPVPVVYESSDGINFDEIDTTQGLQSARHTKTIYNRRGFSTGYPYKIFYWDTSASIYTPGAMRTAESMDGIIWENDRPLTGDYVSRNPGDVNAGTYGPSTIFYKRWKRKLDHINPLNNRYTMYYIATTGGEERNGIAYSLDGTEFYYGGIALDIGGEGEWDARYASSATVIRNRDGTYDIWYSGGVQDSNDGIGHATSEDGLAFVRDPQNPIVVTEPGTWHAVRAYTPMVIRIKDKLRSENRTRRTYTYHMYVSGVGEDGEYSIGLYIGK